MCEMCRSIFGQVGEHFARHDARGDLGDRCADRLGDERHRPAGARIDLDQVNLAVLDRELDVHQPADLEPVREQFGLALDLGDDRGRQAVRRDRAGAVARMDAGFLDMLQHAGNDDLPAVADRIDIDLDRVAQILVDQNRRLGRNLDLVGDIVVELLGAVDDFHRPPAEHVARPRQHRIADPRGDRDRLVAAARHAVGGLFEAELVDEAGKAFAVFGEVDRIGAGAEDRDALGLELAREIERRLAAELDDDADEFAVALFDMEDFEHVLDRQRFEIEPIRSVVIGADTVSGLQLIMIVS